MTWEVGSRAVLRVRVFALDVLTDPTEVTLDVTDPTGATVHYALGDNTVTRESAGVFSVAVELTSAGMWRYTWATSGNLLRVSSRRFAVIEPLVVVGSGDPPPEDPGATAPTVWTLQDDLDAAELRLDALEGPLVAWELPLVIDSPKRMVFADGPVDELAIPLAASGHVDGGLVDVVIPAGQVTGTLALASDLNKAGPDLDPAEDYVLTIHRINGRCRATATSIPAPDVTAPALLGATVRYSAQDELELLFDLPTWIDPVTVAALVTLAFSVGTARTATGIASGNGTTAVSVQLSGALAASDVLTVTLAIGAAQAMNGPAVAPVVAFAVSNEVGDVVLADTILHVSSSTLGADGSAIATWTDESGEGNDLPAIAGGAEPTVFLDVTMPNGGVKVARFNGTTQSFRRTAQINQGGNPVPDAAAFSVIAVVRFRSGAGNRMVLSATDNGGVEFSWADLVLEGGQLYFAVDDGLAPGRAGVAYASTSWALVVGVHNGATRELYVNDVLVGSSATAKNPSALAFLALGAGYETGVYDADIDLAEVRVVLHALTAQERADIRTQAQGRYGTP